MSTYVVGDIHGCYDEWIQLKDRIEAQDSEARFILVGDIIDRGAKVYEMLNWAMQNISSNGKYQMILGNHEEEKIRWLQKYFEYKEEPGASSIVIDDMEPDNYDFYDMCIHYRPSDQQLKNILNWFDQLPYYKEVCVNMQKGKQRFIVVHSYLPSECVNKDGSFKKTSVKDSNSAVINYIRQRLKNSIIWHRDYWGNTYNKVIVVHGHTATVSSSCTVRGAKSGRIWFNNNDINVDCGIVYREHREKANLAAIRLEDLEEFYVYDNAEPEGNENKEETVIYKQEMLEKRKRQKKQVDSCLFDEEFLKDLW
ncbi:MAG: hypothetical protein HDR05_12425 [Lachnospiraceae bacterium]|nr:hypothetical protein [Lachnospiraceae bacterium]